MNAGNSRGRFQPYRGGPVRGRGRGRGRPSERHDNEHTDSGQNGHNAHSGRGRGTGSNRGDHAKSSGPRLVAVRPTGPTPLSSTTWRVLYAMPPSSRPEIGASGEKIPGPFSPPITADQLDQLGVLGGRTVRHDNVFAKKQRVQHVLQQAKNSSSGGMGTYVGKLSKHNNPLIPVLPRLDPK
ncbi:hypothetical protein GGH96_002609 [Coemansia sp. RSA 1972]|nr:hypothetical protein GGH96_002609 [Coemansia sp. RSA 1972]